MIQQTSVFFTNDVAGVLKVLIVIVLPIVLSILGGVWKMIHGPLQDDINDIGKKVNGLDTRQEKHSTEYQILERRVGAVELEQKYLREAFAEVRSALNEVRESSTVNKVEIVGKFEGVMERVRVDFRELRDKVIVMGARAEERDRLQQLIEQAVKRA